MAKMTRREFNTAILYGGVLASASARAAGGASMMVQPATLTFETNGWIPNNQVLPVLHYRGVIPLEGSDPANLFEQTFSRNGWPPRWRYGIYNFHHFHPSAHELLGVAFGSAHLLLGGPQPIGREVIVQAGDVVVLPAGTGHCCLSSTNDFLVVGAYPPKEDSGISRRGLNPLELQKMAAVQFPALDPIYGASGPLPKLWRL